MKKVKGYDYIDIAIAIFHRLNSLYGLGMMLEEDDIDEDEFIEEIEDVLSDMLQEGFNGFYKEKQSNNENSRYFWRQAEIKIN